MEYAIAIFVGVWIATAGLLAFGRIKKDFKGLENEDKEDNQ